MIEANLVDLKNEINMSDEEVKRKNLDLIPYLVKKIVDTVKKNKQSRTARTRIKNTNSKTINNKITYFISSNKSRK